MARRFRKKIPQGSVTVTIDRLSHDGRGIGKLDGKTLFVDNALPGESVVARYVNSRNQFDELVAETHNSRSAERVEPACVKANICGGCSLQHMHTDLQIRHKQQVLLDQFTHFGSVQPETVAPPLVADRLGYRTKARLGVKYVRKYDHVLVGFREKHSNFLTAIESCPILVPAIGEQIEALKVLVRGLSTYEAVPQIEIAFGDSRGAIIIRHMEPLTAADEALLKQFGSEHTLAVYLQPKGPDTVHCLYSPWGEVDLTFASVEGLTMHFRPTDFTQVNLPMNRMMLAQTLDWLKPEANEKVLDLFCGLGNFTLALARHAANVTGVEGSQDMAEQGYRNASANGLDNVQFYAANLHDAELFAGTKPLPWDQTYDCVVLDPPRTGAEEICRTMKRFAPARILYVSCNPATLARDAGILATQGYRLKKVGVMDMFPHTTHVESMALFEKS